MSIFVGVMSGTSLDGLDVAVVRFAGDEERPTEIETLLFASDSYDATFRNRLIAAIDAGSASDLCALDREVGSRIGIAVEEALAVAGLAAADVSAIGSHGQTVWHEPPANGQAGSTLQIGSPAIIAETAGVDVVSDFRSRDMAAGGHGAPLTAYTDALMFSGDRARLIQNIGGIANVTVLPAPDGGEPLAFDTGPGVGLIDGAVRALVPDQAFDRDGRLAAAGTVDEDALAEWLEDPYFAESPPRSTGRERFSMPRLSKWLTRHADLSDDDLVATLTELTARSIAEAYRFVPDEAPVYVCGGGAANPTLVGRLRDRVGSRDLFDLTELGVDPDAREAIAFALLARQHVLGIPANAPWATGAAGRRVLGSFTPAGAS